VQAEVAARVLAAMEYHPGRDPAVPRRAQPGQAEVARPFAEAPAAGRPGTPFRRPSPSPPIQPHAMKISTAHCTLSAPALALALLCACSVEVDVSHDSAAAPSGPAVTSAVCVLRGTDGNEAVGGTIRFTQADGHVHIEGAVSGLAPGKHGFHIHQWGDVDCGDGVCTGGHFDPTGSAHGGPDAEVRHMGDLGNLEAGADGSATYARDDTRVELSGPRSIIGRAVIVHAGEDDLKSQPTGDAGARVAYGVIGIGKSPADAR